MDPVEETDTTSTPEGIATVPDTALNASLTLSANTERVMVFPSV